MCANYVITRHFVSSKAFACFGNKSRRETELSEHLFVRMTALLEWNPQFSHLPWPAMIFYLILLLLPFFQHRIFFYTLSVA